MERIGVVGLSLHRSTVAELERAKQGLARLDGTPLLGCADALGASEAVLLSTCNRCELLFVRESGRPPSADDLELFAAAAGLAPGDAVRSQLFLHAGRAAARHLFRVTASLDSLVLGEDQILAQVRAAAEEARARGLAGRLLGALLEEALHFGKKARTGTELARHPVSVVSLAVEFLRTRLAGLEAPRVAVIGAGATGAHAARALQAAGLAPCFIANRTRTRAEVLARTLAARPGTLQELLAEPLGFDALVSATSAPTPVLSQEELRRLCACAPHGRLVTVDLAVPRDLPELADARHEGLDLETLRGRAEENRARRAEAGRAVEVLLETELARFFGERATSAFTGPYAELVAEVREAFELELDELARGPLAHLDPADRRRVERWARSTFGRLSHRPFRALKALGRADALPESDWEGVE